MFVFRVSYIASPAEAEALAAGDPFVVGGVTRTEVIQFNASQTAPGFSSSSR